MMELSKDFIDLLYETLGDSVDDLVEAISCEPIVSVRVNSRKIVDVGESIVPWCEWGRYLSERPRFTDDPRLHCGCFYVQEASSMFLWHVLKNFVKHDAIVFDACAAPGGKSTLIAEWLDDNGLLICNEYVAKRANILVENIIKWGYPNVIITNNTSAQYENLGEVFDCVVVDAPCSGEGMFRKDEDAVREWSLDNVQICVARQREIIASVWKTLKPGGVMMFSTCTFNHLENEDNVKWIIDTLGGEVCNVPIDDSWGIECSVVGGYHFYPHRVKGEGLFMAVFRKVCGGNSNRLHSKGLVPLVNERAEWLLHSDDYQLYDLKNMRWAMVNHHIEVLQSMLKIRLNIFSAGVQYAEMKGRTWIPAAGLALSSVINTERFVTVNVDRETALKFLKCEAIVLDGVQRGIVLVCYEGHCLGWVKNVGNRCNNLYPQYWRIRN